MSGLTDAEMVDILEDIARNGNNAAARIAAIKQLQAMKSGREPEKREPSLYEVSNPGRIRQAG